MQNKKTVTSVEELICENCIYGELLVNYWCSLNSPVKEPDDDNIIIGDGFCGEGRWVVDGKVMYSEQAYETLYESSPHKCCNKCFDWQSIVELLKREMPVEFSSHNTNVIGADIGKGLYVSENAIEFGVKLYTGDNNV